MTTIMGILLAAGSSSRFGADKLNQPLPDGVPLAVQACRHLLQGTDGVLAVLRPDKPELANSLRREGAQVVVFEQAALGMGASLAFAVRHTAKASGWVVALADMPWIAPSTIRTVTEAVRTGAMIAAPRWQGKRGHPVGFAGEWRDALLALQGDEGAKSLLQTHRQQVRLLACDDPGVLLDVDQPDDLLNSLSTLHFNQVS